MRKFLKWLTIVLVILFSGLFIAIELLQTVKPVHNKVPAGIIKEN